MKNISSLARAVFIIFIISVCSCKKSDPSGPDNTVTGSRNYTWTADTVIVAESMGNIYGIWGSNENDTWLIGDKSDTRNSLFHYDGNFWSLYNLEENAAPFALFGFGPFDVWMGGDSLSFWHYNGRWTRTEKFDMPAGYEISVITDIWGDSPDNVYATGLAIHVNNARVFQSQLSLLFHYDGNHWSRVNIPDMHYEFSSIRRGSSESDKYYILVSDYNTNIHSFSDTTKILEYDGKTFNEIITSHTNWNEALWISEIDRKLYIVKGAGVYKYRNNKLELLIEKPSPAAAIRIWGRNEKDIFIEMQDGIVHYNGSDLVYIYKFKNDFTKVKAFTCFQNTVFMIAYDSARNDIIIKGKLNN